MKSKRSRRNHKASRRSRRASRRNRRASSRKAQRGGWVNYNPAGVGDSSMNAAQATSLQQGKDYDEMHMGQHGGGAALVGAPLDTTGLLDPSLREAARVMPLDASYDAIKGMSDQSGGGKRKRGRRASRKAKRRGSRRGRRGSRRSRQRGGAAMHPADFNAPGLLLPPELASKAIAQMNPEWKLAENPAAFAPKMA
jgi:hypothetical protein